MSPVIVIGPTGEYPEGQLNEEDDGELQTSIGRIGDRIIIRFGVPVAWIGLGASQAREMAAVLNKLADETEH